MSDSDRDWKTRYLQAHEEHELRARAQRNLTRQLVRAVNRVSLACAGVSAELDLQLKGLRALLRLGDTVSAEVIGSKIDVIEDILRGIDAQQRESNAAALQSLDELAIKLLHPAPARELQKRIDAFRKALQGSTSLADMVQAYSVLQQQVRLQRNAAGAGSESLLERLFRRATPAAPSEEQRANVPASAQLEAELELPTPLNQALAAILNVIPRQRLSDIAQPLHETVGQRLRRGLLEPELLPGLDDIRLLMADALQSSEDDLEHFLHGLNARLAETGSVVEGAESDARRRKDSRLSLDDALRRGMDTMRTEVAESTDIVQIKQQVSERVDALSLALDEFRSRERDMQAELENRTQLLRERIIELDQQVHEAEVRLAEQRHLALTDALTQLPNREAWSRKLHEEVARWSRYGHPLSIALCDVDHFKKVNDRFGHATGDEVLVLVARILREQLRETDFVARYGGEEFVILLPETASSPAREVLNQVRKAITAASLSTGERRIRVTASFGIAGFNEGDEAERVFRRADAALYQAKNDGRNRVCIYGMDSPQL